MKSIEAYNKTQSELNKTLNMAFAGISRRIEEAIKVGQTHIQEDLPSEEIRNNVHDYFEEKGYICIDMYTSALCISWIFMRCVLHILHIKNIRKVLNLCNQVSWR